MNILLLSDTHGFIDEKILRHAAAADEIWHAGDIGNTTVVDQLKALKPLRAVYGNIDGQNIRQQFPIDNRFYINGLNVWITHIAGYPGHYEKRVREILSVDPPQLLICGHSHILKVIPDRQFKLLFMNPGAAGIQGFHIMRTMIRFQIEAGKILQLEVIELGKRGSISGN